MVSDSGLHSNVFKALYVRKRRDLSTVKFANFLLELLTQADTITSNKTFEHWRQRDPACREFARAMKTKGKKNTARIWELDLVGQETRAPSIDSEPPCGAPRSRWFFIGIGSIVTKAGEARLAVKCLAFRPIRSRKISGLSEVCWASYEN